MYLPEPGNKRFCWGAYTVWSRRKWQIRELTQPHELGYFCSVSSTFIFAAKNTGFSIGTGDTAVPVCQ